MPKGIFKRRSLSEETKRKIGLANTREKSKKTCCLCQTDYLVIPARKDKTKYCSTKCRMRGLIRKGNKLTESHKNKIGLANRGENNGMFGKKGELSAAWKGGLSKLNELIRGSAELKNWRKSVFKRDNFTCQVCGRKGGYLNADHIKPFSLFPELRFELSNGRTLCVSCHKQTETYGSKINAYVI